jgi:hypothetical protein
MFVREMIMNSYHKELTKAGGPIQEVKEVKIEKAKEKPKAVELPAIPIIPVKAVEVKPQTNLQNVASLPPLPSRQRVMMPPQHQQIQYPIIGKNIPSKRMEFKPSAPINVFPVKPVQPKQMIPPQMPMPMPSPSAQSSVPGVSLKQLDLGKIAEIIRDPTVISVESPGPGKNLLINKHGVIQAAPMVLVKEEIESIMNDISDKTRIPLIPGLFKVVLNDVLVIAVISEFVGTRFLVQKRMPFQSPQSGQWAN